MHDAFAQPEYLHVLTNPVLTHALPLIALGLAVALAARSRPAIRLALVLTVLSAGAVWPAYFSGESAFDRVQAMTDSTGSDWLAIHRHRAEHAAWVFSATALVALVALLVPLKCPRSALPLALAALLAALAASLAGAWIAYPAGRIRHREFRRTPPPPAELQKANAEIDGG